MGRSKAAEAGYTATEALAALMIVGLAVGGLHAALLTLTRSQEGVARETSRTVNLRELAATLDGFVGPYGPFRRTRPEDFTGSAHQFAFRCGTARCAAELEGEDLVLQQGDEVRRMKIVGAHDPSFVYASRQGSGSAWPWSGEAFIVERLRSVAIVDGAAAPLAVTQLWAQQEVDCDFDSVSRDCRLATTP